MTRIHEPTFFEKEITDKGATRRYNYYVLFGINGDQKPTKKKLQRVSPQLLAQLQEVHNQPREEKDRDKKELEKALKILSTRIKPAPGPPLPDSVWEYIYSCDGRGVESFPKLTDATKKALLNMAKQSDFHPASWMLALGEYLSIHFTSNEIGGFIRDLGMGTNTSSNQKNHPSGSTNNLSSSPSKQPSKRIAQLAFDLIMEAGDCTTWHTMAHTVGRIMYLSTGEVKHAAEQVGLDGEGSKVQVVVRMIEMIYTDVLLPITHHQEQKVNQQQYQYSVA